MARVLNIEIPNNKRVVISLTYIYGIGNSLASKICKDAKIDELMNLVRAGMITADKVNEMIDYAKNFDKTDREILINFLRNQIGGK